MLRERSLTAGDLHCNHCRRITPHRLERERDDVEYWRCGICQFLKLVRRKPQRVYPVSG